MREFRFIELLNLKHFYTYKIKFLLDSFSMLDIYTNKLDLDGLKCDLKSVYAEDFVKQASSIQEIAVIILDLYYT